jgi:hypothetical protein
MSVREAFHRGKATDDRWKTPDESRLPIAQNGPVAIRDPIEKREH